MSDLELIDAVAKKTGESLREIGRRGFILTGPEYAGADLDTECMLDLVDLPETGVACSRGAQASLLPRPSLFRH